MSFNVHSVEDDGVNRKVESAESEARSSTAGVCREQSSLGQGSPEDDRDRRSTESDTGNDSLDEIADDYF